MRFCFETTIPLAREIVFRFHENPQRLELLHTGWSKLRILQHEAQIRVGVETWIELTLAGFVPLVLGFRHKVFEAPARFGEEIIHGPFSSFDHIHEFEQLACGTRIRDRLEIRLPRHYGGETLVSRVLSGRIVRMFQNRAEVLARLARNGTMSRCVSESESAKAS